MSLTAMYRSSVARKREEIAKLMHSKAQEQTRFADLSKKAHSAIEAARRTTSQSTFKSKMNEVVRHERDAANISKKIADIEKKLAQKQKELHSEQIKLDKSEQADFKKRQELQERDMHSISSGMRSLAQEQCITRQELALLKAVPQKITVLFLAANPIAEQQLRLDEEARSIYEKLRLSEFRDAITFESRWAVRTLDILQAINECKPTIVHFSGHGADDGSIILQDINGSGKLVSVAAIAQTLKTASDDIRFMFFNSCFSKAQAEAAIEHVEGAIGMNDAVGDEAARIFAAQFYSAVGFGKSVQTAFEQAKAALMLESIPEEDTPELFLQEDMVAESFILVEPLSVS
jgi:hypothetical protein